MTLKDWIISRKKAKAARDFARGKIVQRSVADHAVQTFAAEMRASIAPVPLIRVGGDGDGGYLLADDMDGVRHCFSPGVSVTADFEADIARTYGIRSFLADASVDNPPIDNPLFDFDKKFLGAFCDQTFTTLDAWVGDKLGDTADDDLLLQMDIEGGEFDVLIERDSTLLRRFRMMVIEFHGMERIFEHHSLPLLRALFAKLHHDFAIVHMHANNCCGLARCRDVAIPRVFEITYLRRDRVARFAKDGRITIPHPLDRRNVAEYDDFEMPRVWWHS